MSDAGNVEPASTCEVQSIPVNEYLVLGDSLIQLTTFATAFEQLATDAGLLTTGQHFRTYASGTYSMLTQGSLSLAQQYATARQEGTTQVVVMDGGETDMFDTSCDTNLSYTCATMKAAVSGAEQLFSQFAADGIQHIVYFFYPNPIGNPGLQARLDVLRPLIENLCGQSAIACHWVDLRQTFADHPEYMASDGMLFSDAGSSAAAGAVWQTMESRCIAP